MKVRIKLFAVLRELAGASEVEIELPDGSTVAAVAPALAVRHPQLSRHLSRVAYARNLSYCECSAELHEGDEVALIPPVSGGRN